MKKETLESVNQLRVDLSVCYSELDNQVNHYLLLLKDGKITQDAYEDFTNPLYSEMKKLKDIALHLKEFRMSYSQKRQKA